MSEASKGRKIAYWVLTGLTVLTLAPGGILEIIGTEDMTANFERLGYPTYLIPFLGVLKLAGLLAILVPKFPRLKEWAYAGFVFDLAGAAYSHAMSGDPAQMILMPLVFAVFVLGSYFTRPDDRRLTPSPTTVRF